MSPSSILGSVRREESRTQENIEYTGLTNATILNNPMRRAHMHECLYLNEKNHLIWDHASGREQGITGLSFGVSETAEVGASFGQDIEYQDLDERSSISFMVPIMSLSHFLSLEMRGSSHRALVSRMEWMREAFNAKKMYPIGTNQGFLKLFMRDLPDTGVAIPIFPIPDCRVEKQHLRQHDVMEDKLNPSEYIFIPKPSCDGAVYRVKCEENGNDMWKICGECMDDKMVNDEVTALSRDLA